jgi:acetolactate synthase-1/3 small subunit
MQAKVVDVATTTVTLEYCETVEKIATLTDLVKPYGIREIVRTGTIAIDKGKTAVQA